MNEVVGVRPPSQKWQTVGIASSVSAAEVKLITDQDVQELIAEMDRGRANWINGRGEALVGVEQAPDMPILAPFGGLGPPKGSMTPVQLEAGQTAVSASVFHGGEGHFEVLTTIVDRDLVVLVMVERSMVTFGGFDSPQPWILRTTQVFRRTTTNGSGFTAMLIPSSSGGHLKRR